MPSIQGWPHFRGEIVHCTTKTQLTNSCIVVNIATASQMNFGMTPGEVFLNNVMCTGTEMRLLDCITSGLGNPGPTCAGQAAVSCQESMW